MTIFGLNVQSDLSHWSSTAYESISDGAWFVYMDPGLVTYDSKSSSYYVWPVRGGN